MIFLSMKPPVGLYDILRRVNREDMLRFLGESDGHEMTSGLSDSEVFALYVGSVFDVLSDRAQSAARSACARTSLANISVAVTPLGSWNRGPSDTLAIEGTISSAQRSAMEAMEALVREMSKQWPDLARQHDGKIF